MTILPSDNDDTIAECTVPSGQFILPASEILRDSQQILIEAALEWVNVRGRVAFITRAPITHFNSRIREQYSDLFNKLLFIYTPTFKNTLKMLTQLQRWENNMPDLVIVESLDRLLVGDAVNTDPIVIDQRLCLFETCLRETITVLTERLKTTCHSVATINDVLFMNNPSVQKYPYKLEATINTPCDILPCLYENTERENERGP